MAKGGRVEIRGFGSFGINHRPPRKGRNPKTGATVMVSAKYVPHFKAGKELRERVGGSVRLNQVDDAKPINTWLTAESRSSPGIKSKKVAFTVITVMVNAISQFLDIFWGGSSDCFREGYCKDRRATPCQQQTVSGTALTARNSAIADVQFRLGNRPLWGVKQS